MKRREDVRYSFKKLFSKCCAVKLAQHFFAIFLITHLSPTFLVFRPRSGTSFDIRIICVRAEMSEILRGTKV